MATKKPVKAIEPSEPKAPTENELRLRRRELMISTRFLDMDIAVSNDGGYARRAGVPKVLAGRGDERALKGMRDSLSDQMSEMKETAKFLATQTDEESKKALRNVNDIMPRLEEELRSMDEFINRVRSIDIATKAAAKRIATGPLKATEFFR